MNHSGKQLTITENERTVSEFRMVKSLVRLGDSKELALWTIEHQERCIPKGIIYGSDCNNWMTN